MQTYPTGYAESHRIAEQIFREILPRHGMAVREEQIALCHEILDTLYNKEISLCEAGVGIGKTLAYLVACILWQMHRPSQLKMPVVISTSSVALQDAILNEYLPDLSAIMLAEGIITAPITAVVRKGKERFVCDARLAERQEKAISKGKRQKNSLRMAESILDLDHIPNLTRYDRCRICVPQSCPRDCFLRLDCRYQQYLRDSMKPDIQICNHNYLLANASHRLEERPLLLRQYQVLVVDEAHKLPDAARQMYTETLSAQDMDDLCSLLQQAHFKGLSKRLRTAFLTLSISCTPRFAMPKRKISVPFSLTPFRQAALADCISLLQYIGSQPDMPHYLQYRLAETESLLRLFLLDVPTRILYLEFSADGQLTFCAASNRVPQLLRSALWNTREPTILTSGTLTAAGDFEHTEQLLGLAAYAPLRHFRAESPFNYRKKCLLYIPARRAAAVPENQYLADKIVQLVSTCHGHALVLFTSYRQMRNVYDALGGRLMFPVFQAGRGQNRSIQQFKQSGNGVLFAAGSCWEGIDFPSDMVSLLIIAKLPFPIPDPVSDYERRQYPNLRDYINAEIIPEMQKKLRQGFGRAIRTEQRLYWYPKTHQWYCRHCGMWSNRIRPEELSQQLREKLFWICRHNERICSPQGASNIHSIESSRLSHEINTLLASPEPDAESIVRKILHRAELQFTCCSAGDADPATLQIKRACNELEPTDTFPLKLYAEIVSNVILYRDTHIEIKLRNGQIL